MGPRLLCFAGGAALSAFFVFLGLLATPFFGSGAFLWAMVFGCFLLSLALGNGLGDLLAGLAGRKEAARSAPRLAVLGGLGAVLAAWALPWVCRWVLGQDAEWASAPAAAIALCGVVPGALIAAIAPSELRARLNDPAGGVPAPGRERISERLTAAALEETLQETTATGRREGARGAARLLTLVALGGVAGVALAGKPLLRADEVDVWPFAYATGAGLAALGLALLRPAGRVASGVALAAVAALVVAKPSEIQTAPFAVALADAWERGQGAGLYYLRTAVKERLTDEQLAARAAQVRKLEEDVEKPGVILTCELLLGLGEVTVTGEGIRRSLDLLLPPDAKPFLMPFFHQVDAIRADGKGLFHVQIRRTRGEDGARFSIPGDEPGERVKFWFTDDFTIHITRDGPIWRLEFGPLVTERAGVFQLNDTMKTPVRVLEVALWIDASVLGLIFEDHPDQVVIKALAQGSIGGVKTVDLKAMAKRRKG